MASSKSDMLMYHFLVFDSCLALAKLCQEEGTLYTWNAEIKQ